MKKTISIAAMLCWFACFTLMAGNGNNNGNNEQKQEEVQLVQSGANPYAEFSETPLPECKGPGNPEMICTAQYDPVCGCDGKTYSNACVATREGVLLFVPGECGSYPPSCFDPTQINPSGACPAVYDPVCACGTITFSNACVAQRFGFINTTPGPCLIGQ